MCGRFVFVGLFCVFEFFFFAGWWLFFLFVRVRVLLCLCAFGVRVRPCVCVRVRLSVSRVCVFAHVVGLAGGSFFFVNLLYESPRRKPG